MDLQNPTFTAPSFTLYPLTTQDLKTCYESQLYKVICNINGPYFDRRHSSLSPLFNIQINNHSNAGNKLSTTSEQLVKLAKKLEEVLANVTLNDKYQRMVFDISFEIIENNGKNPASFLLSPLINLLSYTCALRCLEITSNFACSALILSEEKVIWDYASSEPKEGDRILVLASQGRDRKVISMQYSGQFTFVEFEKMTGIAEETNQQLIRFQTQKINQIYDLFHQ